MEKLRHGRQPLPAVGWNTEPLVASSLVINAISSAIESTASTSTYQSRRWRLARLSDLVCNTRCMCEP